MIPKPAPLLTRYRSAPLFCCALGALLGIVPAQAQTGAALQPKAGWAVTRVDDSAGKGPYCTLSRQYENDLILTFGLNTTEEYSLALDFQKAQLDPQRAYRMTLQPGPGQIRAFEMMPVSERAMVIQLGWDQSFFEALAQSQTLKAEIADVAYSFNLPDLNAGQQDLKNCIHNVAQPQQAAASPPESQQPLPQTEPEIAVAGIAPRIAPAVDHQTLLDAESGTPERAFIARKVSQAAPSPDASYPGVASDEAPSARPPFADERPQKTTPAPAPVAAKQAAAKPPEQEQAAPAAVPAPAVEKAAPAAEKQKQPEPVRASQPAVQPAPVAASPANAALTGEIAAAMQEQGRLREENLRLKTALEQERRRFEEQAARTQASAQSAELIEKVRLAEQENKTLRERVSMLESTASAPAQEQIQAASRQGAQVASLERRIKDLEQDNAKLTQQIAQKSAPQQAAAVPAPAVEKVPQADVSNAAAELQKARDALAAAHAERDAARAEAARLANEQEKARLQIAQSASVKDENAKRAESLTQELAVARAALAERDQQMRRLQETNAAVLRDSEQLKIRLSAIEKTQSEAKTAAAAAAEVGGQKTQAEIDTLRAQMALQDRQYKDRIAALERDRDAATAALNARTLAPARAASAPQAAMPATAAIPAAAPQRAASMVPAAGQQSSAVDPVQQSLSGLLTQAGFSLPEGVRKDMAAGSAGVSFYRWDAGQVGGTATVHALAAGGGFSSSVARYIENRQKSCQGDFASVPTNEGSGVAAYEIACVGPSSSRAGSLLFFEQSGKFIAVAHEAAAENMDLAMDARDRVAAALGGSRTN